mgnify:CR=1 FL=1
MDAILVHKHHISTSYLSSMQKVCLNGLNWIFFRVILQKKNLYSQVKQKTNFIQDPQPLEQLDLTFLAMLGPELYAP